jgi:hypothetical protein
MNHRECRRKPTGNFFVIYKASSFHLLAFYGMHQLDDIGFPLSILQSVEMLDIFVPYFFSCLLKNYLFIIEQRDSKTH